MVSVYQRCESLEWHHVLTVCHAEEWNIIISIGRKFWRAQNLYTENVVSIYTKIEWKYFVISLCVHLSQYTLYITAVTFAHEPNTVKSIHFWYSSDFNGHVPKLWTIWIVKCTPMPRKFHMEFRLHHKHTNFMRSKVLEPFSKEMKL